MNKIQPYLIVVYGKNDCPLCARLKKNVLDLLETKQLQDEFAFDYQNLSTPEGMMAYAIAETVNGQRIPALQILKYDDAQQAYTKIIDPRAEQFDGETGQLFVPVYLQ